MADHPCHRLLLTPPPAPTPSTSTPRARLGSFQRAPDDVVRTPGKSAAAGRRAQSVSLGERIGVIGENGTSKSTLLRLLPASTGRTRAGSRPRPGRRRISAARPPFSPGGHRPGRRRPRPRRPARPGTGTAPGRAGAGGDRPRRTQAGCSSRTGSCWRRYEARDGYAADARVESAMQDLGLQRHRRRDRRLGTLSGGEQARPGPGAPRRPHRNCCCSTSRPTTSTSRPWSGWRNICAPTGGSVLAVSTTISSWNASPPPCGRWTASATVHRHGGYPGVPPGQGGRPASLGTGYADWRRELAGASAPEAAVPPTPWPPDPGARPTPTATTSATSAA
ncbi:hypothetical protein LV779_28015 [Streptomyces thinghirensis]|nr:hypothetical protein [Streptomyces thinghirensis]